VPKYSAFAGRRPRLPPGVAPCPHQARSEVRKGVPSNSSPPACRPAPHRRRKPPPAGPARLVDILSVSLSFERASPYLEVMVGANTKYSINNLFTPVPTHARLGEKTHATIH